MHRSIPRFPKSPEMGTSGLSRDSRPPYKGRERKRAKKTGGNIDRHASIYRIPPLMFDVWKHRHWFCINHLTDASLNYYGLPIFLPDVYFRWD